MTNEVKVVEEVRELLRLQLELGGITKGVSERGGRSIEMSVDERNILFDR